MHGHSEILVRKLAKRVHRHEVGTLNSVDEIINDCCKSLQITVPTIVYCESLAKNFSAFYLDDDPYIIFDSCLIEALSLYDRIVLSGNNEEDLTKFFYKLIGEELIRNGELRRCLYMTGKYRQLSFSFDDESGAEYTDSTVTPLLSLQTYFILGHELGHLSVAPRYRTIDDRCDQNNQDEQDKQREQLEATGAYTGKATASASKGVPTAYRDFIDECMNVIREHSGLLDSLGYYLDEDPSTFKYAIAFDESFFYRNFVEECYCDFQGLKLLLEHYEKPEDSVRGISLAMSYLILQEAVRSDMTDNKFFFGDKTHYASRCVYFAVLRMQVMFVTLQVNKFENPFRSFLNTWSSLWPKLVEKIPSEEAFEAAPFFSIPINEERLRSLLMAAFYYRSVR